MYSLELHPDLPIFPENGGVKRGRPPASAPQATLASPTPTPGPVNFSRVVSTPEVNPTSKTQGDGEHSDAESVPPAWPKPGQGVLANMVMNEDDFEDKNDFESFSVATYDATGKKVSENGMPVSSPKGDD